MQLDFEIDKPTRSLENTSPGYILLSEVLPLDKTDLKIIAKESGWKFNWETEFSNPNEQVYNS